MPRSGPPAYAWDWFARQRLPWREVRSRLVAAEGDPARRYAAVETRADVLALLRADYARDETVRTTLHQVIAEVVFLGRTSGRFEDLGVRTAPRGMRWWWSALTGEEAPSTAPARARPAAAESGQLSLDEVFTGYGDGPHAG